MVALIVYTPTLFIWSQVGGQAMNMLQAAANVQVTSTSLAGCTILESINGVIIILQDGVSGGTMTISAIRRPTKSTQGTAITITMSNTFMVLWPAWVAVNPVSSATYDHVPLYATVCMLL